MAKAKTGIFNFTIRPFRIPEANQIMAELLGSSRGIANQYRDNDLQADDMSSTVALDKWISMRAKQGGNQTNLIYFTGHGGKADKKTPYNTTAFLWNNSRLKVSDLVKKLDKLPPKQPCLLVMVQCYSGGFANVIFKEGNPEKGLSDYPRAIFRDRQRPGRSGLHPTSEKRTIMNTAPVFGKAFAEKAGSAIKPKTRL